MKVKEFLESFKTFIKSNEYNVFDVAVASRENNPVLLKLQDIDYLPDSYSVAKSYAVCACGLLYDEGKLALDELLTDIVCELAQHVKPFKYSVARLMTSTHTDFVLNTLLIKHKYSNILEKAFNILDYKMLNLYDKLYDDFAHIVIRMIWAAQHDQPFEQKELDDFGI